MLYEANDVREVMRDAEHYRSLKTYSDKLLKACNQALVLNLKSQVLLENCLKELQLLQTIIHDRPKETSQDTSHVQGRDAEGDNLSILRTEKVLGSDVEA